MRSIIIDAPAKINLYLDITEKRPDGYHNIDTVMQTVNFNDTVHIELTETNKIELTCSDKTLPTDRRNLAYSAAELYNIGCGVRVHIEKRIPIAAGLAGGSSNAAAVLLGLNELNGNSLTVEQLCKLGKKLGADVPFCIYRKACHATGIGEVLEQCEPLPPCNLVIAVGNRGVSTKEAYEKADFWLKRNPNAVKPSSEDYIKAVTLEEKCRYLYNIFERTGAPDEVFTIKNVMLEGGAVGAMMSGSGPSVFGIFKPEDYIKVEAVKLKLVSMGFRVNTVHNN